MKSTMKMVVIMAVVVMVSTVQASLIAEYTFEDDTGGVIADQVGGYDGTIAGTTAVVVDAERGNVLSPGAQGAGKGMLVGGGLDLTGEMSFSVWRKSTDNDGYLVDSQNIRSTLSFGGSGSTTMRVYTAGGNWQTSGAETPTDDVWHHFAFVVSNTGGTVSVYQDGVLAGTAPLNGGTFEINSANPTTFFSRYDTSLGIASGLFDDLQVYDHALSADEVAALAVPEPATLVLLGLGSLVSLRRKK